MRRGRISIARLMGLSILMAADLAWLRAFHVLDAWHWRSAFGFEDAPGVDINGRIFDLGLIGMANVVALGLLLRPPGGRDRRLRVAIAVTSGLLVMALFWMICHRWGLWLLPLPRGRHRWGVTRVGDIANAPLRAVGIDPMAVLRRLGCNPFVLIARTAALTLPQWALAAVAARLMLRMLGRRRAPADPTSGTDRPTTHGRGGDPSPHSGSGGSGVMRSQG